MRYLIIFTILFQASCSTSKNAASKAESDVLKKLEYDAIAAEFRLDTASIAPVMHDGFISISSREVTSKQQELTGMYNNIDQRLKNEHFVDSFYLDEFRVDHFDNTAVVTFFIVSKGRIKGVPFENRRTRFYDVWIKRKGKWKIISMQATPVF